MDSIFFFFYFSASNYYFNHSQFQSLFKSKFFRFSKEENFQNIGPAKSSIGKAIRQSLLDQMPNLASVIDDILPKKEPINIAKW